MNPDKINSLKDIADIHEKRIKQALEHLQDTFPLTEQSVQNLNDEEFLYMELLSNRFSKLQDHLGSHVFDAYFNAKKEDTKNLTMIDKLNKLEKFGIINDAGGWGDMRDARNIISHEYPDNPKLMADTLNQVKGYCTELMSVKQKLVAEL